MQTARMPKSYNQRTTEKVDEYYHKENYNNSNSHMHKTARNGRFSVEISRLFTWAPRGAIMFNNTADKYSVYDVSGVYIKQKQFLLKSNYVFNVFIKNEKICISFLNNHIQIGWKFCKKW